MSHTVRIQLPIYALGLCSAVLCFGASETLTLDSALSDAFNYHPELKAAEANVEAEESAVSPSQWPSDPMLGVMLEQNQNFMQQQMGRMTSLMFSQNIDFPAKYVLRGRVQKSRVEEAKANVASAKRGLRSRVIAAYYQLYAAQQLKTLTEAQNTSLSAMIAAAKARYISGAAPQQDVLKAQLEQTRLANDLISLEAQAERARTRLALLVGKNKNDLQLPSALPVPTWDPQKLDESGVSPNTVALQIEQSRVTTAERQKTLAVFDYFPDLRLSASTMVGDNRPADNFRFVIEFSVPLWFLTRQNAEVSMASARVREARFALAQKSLELSSDIKESTAEIGGRQRLLQSLETTLIPQSEGALLSSRNAYVAGKASFLDVLDSVRALLAAKSAYYQNLSDFALQLATLEERCACVVTSLPQGGP